MTGGYVICMGQCCACGAVFGFNPNKVPSMKIDGVKEPVCLRCVTKINEAKAELGLPVFEIPPGAYEAALEEEIMWK